MQARALMSRADSRSVREMAAIAVLGEAAASDMVAVVGSGRLL